MKLRQLEVFQAVMQTGHMSAAGRLMSITPSAVSKIVAHTELQLGYALFVRSRGSLVPTPEALILFKESTDIHRQVEALRSIAANLRRTNEGRIRMAALPAISLALLPSILRQHESRYGAMPIEVRTLAQGQMAHALVTRSIDFALGFCELPHPQITGLALGSGGFHAVMPEDVWRRALRIDPGNPMRIVRSMPFIHLISDDPVNEAIDRCVLPFRSRGSDDPALQVDTSHLALELVRRGLGWTVVDFLTAASVDRSSMAIARFETAHAISLYAYHAADAPPSQFAKRMLGLVKAQLGSANAPSGAMAEPVTV